MTIPMPKAVQNRSDVLAAANEALSMPWAIVPFEQIADIESKQHLQRVSDTKSMFAEASRVFAGGVEQVDKSSQRLRGTWQDDNYNRAYGDPVEGYKKQLQDAQKQLGEGEHITALGNVETAIGEAATAVPPLKQEFDGIMPRLRANAALIANWRSLAWPLSDAENTEDGQSYVRQIWADINRLQEIDMEGYRSISKVDLAFGTAAKALPKAAEFKFNGPSAATPPTGRTTRNPSAPSGPGSGPSGGPSGEQPGGEQPGGEQPGGEQPGGQQGGEQAGGEQGAEQPGGGTGGELGGALPGDTGLSGGPATTIPPTTMPKLPDTSPYTPSTPSPVPTGNAGSPGGFGGIGAGGLGSAGVGGPGTRQPGAGGNSAIQQAARQYSSSPAASTGQAPSLSGLASRGTAAQAGAGMGGVPPMMPPMMPQGGGSGNVKPGTAQSAGTGRNRPAGATPGVPNGLRGRTGKSEHTARSAGRRARRDEPENVERLDSELWDVDRQRP